MDKTNIVTSIVTSIIASIIFWIVFNLMPSICKYLRIRPRVEKDIDDIKMQLFFFIQIPFLQGLHTPSIYQSDIENDNMKKEDFGNALYGKCFTSERCIGEFKGRLLPVRERLVTSVEALDERLDRIQRYSDFLKTKEILLLKEIGEKLHVYEFEEYKAEVDGVVLKTINPSLSYMKTNFYELYVLYHKLKKICDAFILVKRKDIEKYKIARHKIDGNHYIGFFVRWVFLNKEYKVLTSLQYHFKKGHSKKTKKKLQEFLKLNNQKLIYLRGNLDYFPHEDTYRSEFIRLRGEDEVDEWISCVDSEELSKKNFEKRNLETKKIINEKEKNEPKKTERSETEIKIINKLFDGYLWE